VLIRLSDAALRLDRAALPRVLDPLLRLDRAAAARLLPVTVLLRCVLRVLVAAPTDRLSTLVVDWLLPPSASLPAEPPAPRHAARRLRRRVAAPARELAVCSGVVLLVALLAAANQPAPAAPALAVQAAQVETVDRPGIWSVQVAERGSARPEARPALPEPSAADDVSTATAVPLAAEAPAAAEPQPAPAPEPAPAPQRWLPEGTGMWLHDWSRSEGGNAAAVVARSQSSGFTHLYVQTGSTKKGWIGDEVLGQLLPATQGTGIKVIAWDFPKLIDPAGDARRLAYAAWFAVPGAPQVAAVAPDVETAAEGTQVSAEAVSVYYATLRAELPPHVAILATVPWPSEKRTGWYPYAQTAAQSDAFVPMAYWYNRRPEDVTWTSMAWLSQFGLPVMPVGQGYDGRIDAPYLPPDPDPAGSVQRFVDHARMGGAQSISLWSWQTTGLPQWDVLFRASTLPWPPAV
jgi:hypothetical protein